MEIGTFAALTRRIIARDGIDGFLPTACYPARKTVAVLEGIPDGVDVERAACIWALRRAEADEEVLIAFRSSIDHFKIMRHAGGDVEEASYPLVEG